MYLLLYSLLNFIHSFYSKYTKKAFNLNGISQFYYRNQHVIYFLCISTDLLFITLKNGCLNLQIFIIISLIGKNYIVIDINNINLFLLFTFEITQVLFLI